MSHLSDTREIRGSLKTFKKSNSFSLSATDIFHLKRVQTQSNSDFLSIPVDLQVALSFNGLKNYKLRADHKAIPKYL